MDTYEQSTPLFDLIYDLFTLDCTYNVSKPKVKDKIVSMSINGSNIRDTARVLK